MQKKIYAMSAAILAVTFLAVVLVFSAEAVSTLANINPVGALAAAFAAVVGFAWLVKKH